ncbi:hypothetical protein L7F22_012602 [Adiantum nelumboides]|nr:hypothetical protein [Adiantum nelumboides]
MSAIEVEESSSQLAILDRYISGKLNGEAATMELTVPVMHAFLHHHQHSEEEEKVEESAESLLWATWGALMGMVRRTAYNDSAQDLLVHLLSIIKKAQMPPTSASTFWGGKFWQDLPVLVQLCGLDDHVPAAATWVLEVRHLMFELALQVQPPDCINNASNGGSLWAGYIWYNRERWAFWKQGFNSVMGQAELHSWTKEMAARAYQTMEQIEQQAGWNVIN